MIIRLQYSKQDTLTVFLLNEISWEYQRNDIEKAKFYAEKALNLSGKLSYPEGMASSHNNYGLAFMYNGEYEEALDHFNRSAEIRKLLHPNGEGLASIYNNMGVLYATQADYDEAISWFQNALNIRISNNDTLRIASGYHNIGILYYYQGQLQKAQKNYFSALRIFEQWGDKKKAGDCSLAIGAVYGTQGDHSHALEYYQKALELLTIAGDNIQIADCYSNIGEVQLDQSNIDAAEKNFQMALQLREEAGYQKGMADSYNEMGDLYEKKEKYSKALKYKEKALNIQKVGGNKREEADYLSDIGYLYCKSGQPEKAVEYFEESIRIAGSVDLRDVLYNAYSGIEMAHEQLGQYKEALVYHKIFDQIKDSLLSEESRKEIVKLESQYKVENAEQKNRTLAKENELQALAILGQKEKQLNQLIIMIGAIIFILFVSLLFYSRYRYHYQTQLDKEKILQEKIRFRSMIESEEKERRRIASDLHDGLGHLLSITKLNMSGLENFSNDEEKKLVTNSIQLVDEACNEIRSISHNLMPMSLIRQGLVSALRDLIKKINDSEKIEIDFIVDERMDSLRINESSEIAIYRVIQEILNNTIKHAKADKITIEYKIMDDKLFVSIQDNGMGFEIENIDKGEGIGWQNIVSRVAVLDGQIEINSDVKVGTCINVEIPNYDKI